MIGVDSNVLVRYIVADDEDQTRRAAAFLEGAISVDDPGFVSIVVLVELVWVLERTYRFSPDEIIGAIESVLRGEPLRIDPQGGSGRGARRLPDETRIVRRRADRDSCRPRRLRDVVTFDRKAARLPGFRLL